MSTPTPAGYATGRILRPSAKSLPEHSRSHNRALVLQTLYRSGGVSRADLARATGLTRVTISDLVAQLIGDDLVVELGQREDARPGKPATLLDINRAGFHVIGIDLSSSTTFRGVITDLSGTVVARDEIEVARLTGAAAVAATGQLIEDLHERWFAREWCHP